MAPRRDREELETIKTALRDRIVQLCARLLPDGRQSGRFWIAHNPQTGDAATHPHDPTLKVALDKDVGAWKDWRSGDKGDVIRLVEHCLGLDFKRSMDWCRDFLGIRSMGFTERRDFARRQAQARAEAEARAVKKAADVARRVDQLWAASVPIGEDVGAAAHARRYLDKGRGVPIAAVDKLDPRTFRAHPALEWWEGARWETKAGQPQKVAPGPKLPALVSGFFSPTGILTAVHCTFLDPVAPAKAPIAGKKARLMFGPSMGSIMSVSLGPEGVAHELGREPHPTIGGEGVEDGLSLAIAIPEARVWACGSLAHIGAAPFFLPCVGAAIVAADNDWKSPQAREQLDDVLAKVEAHGKPVEVMRSAIGKDFNDGMTE